MNILFIASSYVYYQPNGNSNLRTIAQFEQLASRGGHSVTTALADRGGASVKDHWEDTGYMYAQGEIRSGQYDSILLGGLPNDMHNGNALNGSHVSEFNNYTNRFANLIEANGGDMILYTSWQGDWNSSFAQMNGSNPFGNDVQRVYEAAANRHDAGLAPVGLAYSDAYVAITNRYGGGDNGATAERLLTADEIHPTTMMSYLQANVFYWAVFNEAPPSPSSYRPSGLSVSDAQLMQSIAASAFRDHGIAGDGSTTPQPPTPPTPPTPEPNDDGEVSGRLWVDSDGDNLEDNNEPGVSGTTVSLVQSGRVVATDTTDGSGRYGFTDLSDGYYAVHFARDSQGRDFVRGNSGGNDQIDSDVWTTNGDGTGVTSSFLINGSQSMLHADAGLEVSAPTPPTPTPPTPTPPTPTPGGGTLAGRYFNDENGDNREGTNEAGVSGARVSLFRSDGTVIETTTTNSSGNYSFEGLANGWYGVYFAAQGGRDFVRVNVGGNDALDSDVWRTLGNGDGESAKYQITSTRSHLNLDAGLTGDDGGTPTPPTPTPPTPTPGGGTLAGRYFFDANGNNREDGGEAGVAGATISLVRGNGQVAATTTTDASGSYSFSGLADGWYGAYFEAQPGRDFVRVNVGGNDALDSDVWRTIGNGDGESAKYQITSSRSHLNLDAGLTGDGGGGTTTPTPPPPTPGGGAISGRYFVDANRNDFENSGEPGVSGATVTLMQSNRAVATTTTDGNGNYSFTGRADGWYHVLFEEEDGFEFIRGNVGSNEEVDSDVWRTDNNGDGVSSSVFVSSARSVTHVDAGVESALAALIEADDFIV